MSTQDWAQRVAVLRVVINEGGTVYHSQLTPSQQVHVAWLVREDCLKNKGGKLIITAIGRRMVNG